MKLWLHQGSITAMQLCWKQQLWPFSSFPSLSLIWRSGRQWWQTLSSGQKFKDKRISQKITPPVRNMDALNTNRERYAGRLVLAPHFLPLHIKMGFVSWVHFLLRPQVLPAVLSTKHLFFMHPLRAVFHNQISTAHSVLFHFLMTVQPLSLNALTRMLLVTPRLLFSQTFVLQRLSDFPS